MLQRQFIAVILMYILKNTDLDLLRIKRNWKKVSEKEQVQYAVKEH